MREVGRDEPLETADEFADALRWNVELESLDRNQTVARGIERAKYWTQCAGAHLVEHAKRTEGLRRRTSCFRVQ